MGVRLELTRYPSGRSEDDAEGCRPVGLKGEPTEADDPPGRRPGAYRADSCSSASPDTAMAALRAARAAPARRSVRFMFNDLVFYDKGADRTSIFVAGEDSNPA